MIIAPEPDPLTAPYWEGARNGQLLLQHCQACAACWHPPLPRCPSCLSDDVAWRPAAGEGHVYSYTVIHHATHPAVEDNLPYLVALVELKEGPRVVTNIRGCPAEDVHVGMAVRVVFEPCGPATLPQFTPA
jgi:uncharacterized OB-fold protein